MLIIYNAFRFSIFKRLYLNVLKGKTITITEFYKREFLKSLTVLLLLMRLSN